MLAREMVLKLNLKEIQRLNLYILIHTNLLGKLIPFISTSKGTSKYLKLFIHGEFPCIKI